MSRVPPLKKAKPGEERAHTLPLAPPTGMHDLLFPESELRRELGRRLVETFGRWGYELVSTPPFEHAEVLERGLETVDRRDLLRFVEPESGEVALLRPDITPQIARVIATRLADKPPPWRLCYEGSVFRRRRGRARRQREIQQAGVECVGLSTPDADAEVIHLAARACEAVGLEDFRIELGQVRLAQAALMTVPEAARANVAEALAQKDAAMLEHEAKRAQVPASERRNLLALIEAYGGRDVIESAKRIALLPGAREALDELEDVFDRVEGLGLAQRLDVDLGELRGQSYYTGVSFTLLANGPGEAIGYGGRYDNLLGRFDAPAPATGFAIDEDNLEWALAESGHTLVRKGSVRWVVASTAADTRERFARVLRNTGAVVAELPESNADTVLAWARAWGYSAAFIPSRSRWQVVRMRDGAQRALGSDASELAAQVGELGEWASAAHAGKDG